MIVQEDQFQKNVEEIRLNTNLFGENDTPDEIYSFSQKMMGIKEYDMLLDNINILCKKYNRAECYVLKAKLYGKLSNFEKAYLNYNKAISCNQNNAAYFSILGREYLVGCRFYEAIDVLSKMIENTKLKNYEYYVSYREHRLIAACCIGDWKIANEDINYLPNDFVLYTQPVVGVITKDSLSHSIENKKTLKIKLSQDQFFRSHIARGNAYKLQLPKKTFPRYDGLRCNVYDRAKLIQKAEEWKYGSLHERVEKNRELLSEAYVELYDEWVQYVNQPLKEGELENIRNSVNRQAPLGQEQW